MSTAIGFRAKKVQAMRFAAKLGWDTGYNHGEILTWVANDGSAVSYSPERPAEMEGSRPAEIQIGYFDPRRMDTGAIARVGDWIVRTGKGKFTVMPDDEFKVQYEVDE